jgi:NTE family protein
MLKNIAFVIIIISLSVQLYGQRVGLVLSGGGARGVTHIGILKALEENNIPVDYIAGTSMGAIIGGLYASGYTPKEIEQLFTSKKMESWISGNIEPKYMYYFKKPESNAAWQIFKITYDSVLRVQLPTNIISPYEMDFGLMELFSGAGAAAGYNFDNLYIPFRCVASDISDNKLVVLKQGELDKAIRASMTFPFYFKPIRIDGKLMFDGGMYNNFPVDVLNEDFNPEIIIGCKAASNYGPPQDGDIISQVQSMLMVNTDYAVDTNNGVLIIPELRTVNIRDFSNTREFIDSGYTAALKQIPKINKLLKIKESKEKKKNNRAKFHSQIPPLKIGDIKVRGISNNQALYVKKLIKNEKLLRKLQNSEISEEKIYEAIKSQYYKLLAEEQIESISPELIYDPESGFYELILNIYRSNKIESEIGGLVSSKAINEIFFQLQYNRWGKSAFRFIGNIYLGRFHSSGLAAARIDVPAFIPFAMELSYTRNNWNYFKTSTYFLEDDTPIYLIQTENHYKFDLSTPITKFDRFIARFSAGQIKDEYYQTNQFSRLDTTDITSFDFNSPAVIYELNTHNRKQYPSEGVLLRLCGRLINGTENNIPGSTSVETKTKSYYHNWFQVRFIYDNYFKTSGFFKLGIYGEATLSNKPVFNNYTSTILSATAFQPIPESQTIFLPQFRAHNYVAAGLKLVFNLYQNLEFRSEGYIFQPFKEIIKTPGNKADYGKEFSNRYYMAGGSFVYHAAFGPISICLNYYDQADEPFSFNINIGYFIFNKKPFQ